MTTVQGIEKAITSLDPEQLNEVFAWLDENQFQFTDIRIALDVEAGRLDHLIFSALEDEREGRLRPL